ncbi:MAG: murein biosynthesis integral membrane protein MurJ [Weeksellaceae bacterium]
MNKLLTKTRDFIFAQQTSIFSSTLILAGMIILSRCAGFIRYRILAGYFTTPELDVYFAAFRIPDLIFEILINGALSTTFIPFFIEYQKKQKEQNSIISSIINVVCLSLAVFIVVMVIIMPILVPLITPGFTADKIQEIIWYSRLILIGQLPFLVVGNFLTGMSQAKKSFLLPAIAPIIYNVAIIVATLMFSEQYHLLAPVIGVIAGAFLFLVIQLPVLTAIEFRYQLVIKNIIEAKRFFRTAIPRILTIIVAQIDATIDLSLTTFLGAGSYTVFYLAQHLQLLPVSIVGIAFGQASLPYLSEMYQDKRIKEFKDIIVTSMLNILFLTIPAAAFFIIARTPLVRLFFGGDKFDWPATVMTATTLSYFAFSMPLHSIYYFLTRCYYAVFDTRTPFYTSLAAIGLNAGLSVLFTLVFKLPVWSLAIAFSISMSLHVILLLLLLYKKIKGYDIQRFITETIKIIIASFNSSVITYLLMRLLDGLIIDTSRTLNVLILLVIGCISFFSLYLFLSWLFGIKELYILSKMVIKVREYQRRITELYRGVE